MHEAAGPPRITLFVSADGVEARLRAEAFLAAQPNACVLALPPSREWPFDAPPQLDVERSVRALFWAPDVHEAFDTAQPPHTRLVTTQAQYQFAELETRLARADAMLVASAAGDVLRTQAPEVLHRRGVFSRIAVRDESDGPPAVPSSTTVTVTRAAGQRQAARLADAFRSTDAATRLAGCVQALDLGRTPATLVATASVCQEVNDLESAARDLDEALSLAPDWAAAHFERGKVWLRRDDMEAAAKCFQAAAECLPGFGGAWGNLGATLGELDRPGEALTAFERLLALDPASPQAHNNVGVVSREIGRLPESEAAFRRVITLEPDLAFGYYNLGHTLFLQGRYQAAASAYTQGQARDPERNPVQATRLALCRLATGDAAGALAELRRASDALPREYRRQVLADTSAVLWALVTQKPDLNGWQRVHEWLTSELARLA